MVQIQATISLREWQNYQNGKEAIAYSNEPENEKSIRIIFNEKELIAIEDSPNISFVIKKEI